MRLRELSAELASAPRGTYRASRDEAWILLHAALSRFLASQARKTPDVSGEDLQDLATEKSLDLLRRIESGAWDLSGRHPLEIARYLSRTARNGLLDLCRKTGRHCSLDAEHAESGADGRTTRIETLISRETPDIQLDRTRYAGAIRHCFEQLTPRLRRIWFFRVFGGLPSKTIATHPDVKLKSSHIDVLLHRSRQAIGDCMRRGNFDAEDMPPGVFTELLKAFHAEMEDLPKESGDDR